MGKTATNSLVVLLLILTLASTTGCIDAGVLFAAADAGLQAYESSVPEASSEYQLADKIDTELQALNALYTDAEKASSGAKPGIEAHIASVVAAIAKDGQSLLNVVAIKNPHKRQIVAGVIAAVEAFIVFVQDRHPNPSGDSVMLNSTAAQLKAAAAKAQTTARR